MDNKYKLLIMVAIIIVLSAALVSSSMPPYIGGPIMIAVALYMPNSKWGRMDG